jgi:hypothetical protein
MARRVVRSVGRGSKRQTTWLQFVWAGASITAEGGTLFFTLNAAALAMRPFTVVRSHFELMMISDQVAASEIALGAFGIGVFSEEALTAGVASIPTPVNAAASDFWFVHQWIANSLLFNTSGAANTQNRYTIDSKAMRKVGEGQDIGVVAEGETTASSLGFTLHVAGRMLIKNN